ncbi:MAG: VWA domain-containing protein, partial [Puniceicoccaceae bacterium]
MIEFADRFWLLLLPFALALVLLLFHIDRKGRRASIRRFASDRLVGELVRSYSPLRKRFKNGLLLLAAALLFLALARPQWGHTWSESRSRGIDVVFALDSSRSMLATDIKPNRLIRAKLAIEDFVNQLEGDRIGLVAFAGNAFLQCPLTLDYGAFFQSLEAVDTNVISAGGTDLAAALREAEAAFSSDNNFRIVILITDGEDLEESGVRQAGEAAERGVTVYAVGVGTEEGGPIPLRTRAGATTYVRDEDGNVVHSRLDSDTLERIASETGGFFVELGPTGYGLEQVLEAGIGSIPEEEISSQLQRTAIERFQWPLAAAVFLLLVEPLVGTRRGRGLRLPGRRAAVAAVALGLLPLPPFPAAGQVEPETDPPAGDASAPAPEPDDEPPAPEPDDERPAPASPFARAVRENPADPVAYFNHGTELYDAGDYSAAAERFTEAIRLSSDFPFQADAFYNLGNTRFQEGSAGFEGAPPEAVTEQATAVMAENDPPMRNGEGILETARAGRTPPQDAIRSAIGALEQRETTTDEAIDTLSSALASENATRDLWRRAINDFESALELAPDHRDARHNLGFVKKQTAALTSEIAAQNELKKGQEQQLDRIRTLIEELRELLEEQENQDQQQEQQQDQQQEQQQD